MPRELITRDWCDPCFSAGEHNEGDTHTITLDRRKPRELILCERHGKELMEPLQALLDDAPIVDAPTSTRATATRPTVRAGSAGTHPTQHGTPPPGHVAPPVLNPPADLPAPTVGPEGETVWTCEEHGLYFSTKERARPSQSIRLHLRRVHGQNV